MTNDNNLEMLKAFMSRSDPKQMALVGVQALGVLAQAMTDQEFQAFLHDVVATSEKHHIKHMKSIKGE